jgi:excinuclease ABC subunit C
VRIECFDVSTIQGAHTVGSLVVFENAQAKRAHYRKFSIRNADGQDDYAALEEMIARRFARAHVPATDDDWDESFSAVPNLVVVDGGRGQLSAALDAMRSLDLPRVAVVSLAKRDEEVFVPGVARPIRLDRSSAGLQLLQRIRDEAHRFAVGYHRQKRDAAARESILDELPGVGPARRRALLQHFGSVEQILAASREELEGVPGVPPKTARAVYEQLHKAGPVARGD